ncbi:MAG: S41 family peptidase [Spirochaetes bacterium]|nr:S41 family peptidase [Spirochaetota bacterium]
MRSFFTRERIAWTVVSVALLAAVVFFAFSPRLVAATPEEETRQYLSTLGNVFRFVRDSYVDGDKAVPKALYEGALKGMFEALGDPYSEYLTADDMSGIDDTTLGVFGGVGLIITKIDKVGAEVVSPIDGTPAYRAGVSAGDMIIKVDGVETADLSSDDIVKRLRGKPETPVAVTIRRGETIVFDVTIVRAQIEVPTVKHAMMPGSIGYLRISQFTPQTLERVQDAVNAFKAAGYRAMVVDVRQNPGGLLSSVEQVADLFLSGGPVVSTRSERVPSENTVYEAKASASDVGADIPVAVLVDKGSASASEILAGALKDTGRAKLFGVTTYGKGSVQQVRRLGDGGFKLTMARYYTPGNYTIDKNGVTPDVTVEEPAVTVEQESSLAKLLQENTIRNWVAANPQPSNAKVGQLVDELHRQGIALDERTLRRLVRAEVNRTNNNPPVYDLEYDIALQAAVKAIQAGQVVPKALP